MSYDLDLSTLKIATDITGTTFKVMGFEYEDKKKAAFVVEQENMKFFKKEAAIQNLKLDAKIVDALHLIM